MPFNPITAAPTAAQTTAVNSGITSIDANEPYKVTLTDAEKGNYQTVKEERYPYVVKAIRDLAPVWVSKMAPDVVAMIPRATISLQVMETYRPAISRMKSLVELFNDAYFVAAVQAYNFLKAFYGDALAMQSRGVPGADALVAELAPLFAKDTTPSVTLGPVV